LADFDEPSDGAWENTVGQEIEIKSRDGKSFAAYLALPAKLPAPGIVLLPEVFNTNPHIRSVSDGYAADGFVVLAPDVYWRQEPGAYMAYTDEGRAKAQALRARLDTDQFAVDLEDTIAALRVRPDCSGKVGVMGFCLGGNSSISRPSVTR
jgi:carboxymethylenebutenolidase